MVFLVFVAVIVRNQDVFSHKAFYKSYGGAS